MRDIGRELAILVGAIGLCLSPAAPAAAQDGGDGTSDGVTIFGRSLSVSLQARVAPSYLGSDRYEVGPTGSISFTKPGEDARFSAPDDGLSIGVVGGDNWSVGLSGAFRGKRDNDHELRGFDEVDWAVEAGAYANFWLSDSIRLRGAVRRGFNGHEGWVAEVGADAVHSDETWVLSIGPRARWTDAEFNRTYFGVTPVEAARSPFAIGPYSPGDATASVGVLASAEYRWSPRWSVIANADYNRLLSDAADSPIVRDLGSRNQFSAALGLKYSFGR